MSAQNFMLGVFAERDRIIKLINSWSDDEEFSTVDDLIALIKGETQ